MRELLLLVGPAILDFMCCFITLVIHEEIPVVVNTAIGAVRTAPEPGLFNDGACIEINQKVTVRTSLEHNVPRAQRSWSTASVEHNVPTAQRP